MKIVCQPLTFWALTGLLCFLVLSTKFTLSCLRRVTFVFWWIIITSATKTDSRGSPLKNPSLIDRNCAIGKAVSFHNLRFRYSRPQAWLSSRWSKRYKGYAVNVSLYRAPPEGNWELRIKDMTITSANFSGGNMYVVLTIYKSPWAKQILQRQTILWSPTAMRLPTT